MANLPTPEEINHLQRHRKPHRQGGIVTVTPAPAPTRERTYPVIEIFGPTIQGEGALAGAPTLFVRFGGCDYRCSWCDSMYAVDPAQVRENATKMTKHEIVTALCLQAGIEHDYGHPVWRENAAEGLWVTLSGGNPALMDFNHRPREYAFVIRLQRWGFRVAVETQGSVWRPWLADVDHLTVSPKPPSSGMLTDAHRAQTEQFLNTATKFVPRDKRSLKIVVFDDHDLEYARAMFLKHRDFWPQQFISAGTDQENIGPGLGHRLLADVAESYRWLAERVAGDPDFRNVRVLCQLHVIAWGAARGV